MSRENEPVAAIQLGDSGSQVNEYVFQVLRAHGRECWDLPTERLGLALQARKCPTGDDRAVNKSRSSSIVIGMSRQHAQTLALQMLRQLFKDDHSAKTALLDVLEKEFMV